MILYYKSTLFRLEKSGSANSDFFSGLRKVLDQKKEKPRLQNHLSKTTLLQFSKKLVAD